MSGKLNRVLLVDDDSTTNFLHSTIFQGLNQKIDIVIRENGKEAIDYIKKHYIDESAPSIDCADLILLDLNMPIMDGFEVLKQLQELHQENLIRTMIVVLSTSSHPNDISQAKKLGVSKFIEKPLTGEKVSQLMELM